MRRIRWVLIAFGVLAVAAVVAWGFWSSQPTPSVDRKVIDAYAQKGATYGWMQDHYDNSSNTPELNFLSCNPDYIVSPSQVPAFQFKRFDDVRADELPAVGRPFGLDLSGSRLSDGALGEATKLTQLARLDLADTPVTDTGLEHLAGATGLTHLSLRGTRVTDDGLRHLAGLTNLTYLDLRRTGVTDAGLAHLAGLTGLTHIDLREVKLTGRGVSHLAALPALSELDLDTPQVTDEVTAALGAAGKLHTLYAQSRRRPARDTDIHEMWLSHTPISDAAVKHLVALPNLTWLDLGGTRVTDSGMEALAGHAKLESLAVSGTEVTDAGIMSLISSNSLKYLYLSDEQVTDELLASLTAAHKMHLLMNRAQGALMPEIRVGSGVNQKVVNAYRDQAANDPAIRRLSLARTRISDAAVASLADLTDLEELDLTDTKVTDEGKKRIREKLPKCRVLP